MNIDNINTCLESWIFGDPCDLPFKRENFKDDNEYWRAMHLKSEWSDFATIALRFIIAGASEADVEREISIGRKILGNDTVNIMAETLGARLRLQKNNK